MVPKLIATSYQWTLPQGATAQGATSGPCITVNFSSNFHGGNICVKAVAPCGIGANSCKNIHECPSITCPPDIYLCFNFPDKDVMLGDPVVVSENAIASIENNAPAVYPVGTTEVTWIAVDSLGNSLTCIQRVVRNVEANTVVQFSTVPVAQSNIIHVCLGAPVYFIDQSVGVKSWQWDFGDGFLSTESDPVHSFNISGTYTVTLVASNGCGTKKTLTAIVQVEQLQGPDIICLSTVCPGETHVYSTSAICSQYIWSVSGGTIVSVPLNNDSIQVVWGNGLNGDGTITLEVPVAETTATRHFKCSSNYAIYVKCEWKYNSLRR